MSKIVLVLFVSLFFLGCGGSTPQPSQKMPSWYLSETPSDSMFFYGVGEGKTKEEAQAKALAQISGAISTTVESNMEVIEKDSTESGYSHESRSNIKSSTDSIKFTGITVIDTVYIQNKFYTYLKVDRDVLFNALKSNLDSDYNKAVTLSKQMRSEGAQAVLKNSKKLQKLLDSMLSKPIVEILKSIKPSFDAAGYRKKLASLKVKLESYKSNTLVYLTYKGKLSKYYRDVLAKYISGYGFTLVEHKKAIKNALVVNVAVSAQKKNVRTTDPRLRGATFAEVIVTITTKNHEGKIVAQNRVTILNISKDGLGAAQIKTKKFERKIKKEGIVNILLKTRK